MVCDFGGGARIFRRAENIVMTHGAFLRGIRDTQVNRSKQSYWIDSFPTEVFSLQQ
jgi:hypothetical protein